MSTGIRFEHLSSPEQKDIVESMSGGVALIDYDGDGWMDIYFTAAPSVAMELAAKKARGALYHNNHDGRRGLLLPSEAGWNAYAGAGDQACSGWRGALILALLATKMQVCHGGERFGLQACCYLLFEELIAGGAVDSRTTSPGSTWIRSGVVSLWSFLRSIRAAMLPISCRGCRIVVRLGT